MSEVTLTCPSCAAQVRAQARPEQHAARCPKCRNVITVPASGEADPETPRGPWPSLLVVGAAAIIALGAGLGAGLIVGHQWGRADNARDVADAQARAADAEGSIGAVRAQLASEETELRHARERHSTALRELENLRATVRTAQEQTAAEAERKRQDEAKQADERKRVESNRKDAVPVVFKDLANFPEEYAGRCVRMEGVWLGGDPYRVKGSRSLSPTVSSTDGKHVFGSEHALEGYRSLVFVMPENIGRGLSVGLSSDHKYMVNLNCELRKGPKSSVIAEIYRVETLNHAGNVKDVIEER
jgi:hypothetical protein